MCLSVCLSGTGVVRHTCRIPSKISSIVALREPRSRFPGACGGRDLMDLACLPAASLFEGLAPARVHERVRLPLASRLGVDKLVHGQRTSIINRPLALVRTRPCPHTSRRYKVLERFLRTHSATGEKPYSIYTTKHLQI